MADQRLTDKGFISSIADADLIHIVDVSDTTANPLGTSKKSLWSLIKSTLKTYFDTLYVKISNLIEENIVGTAIENAAMTGTVNLDLDTFSYFKGELTGATTITVTNEPAFNTSFVKSLKINSTTTESITLPATWDVIGSYVADGSDNYFTIIFSNLTIAGANATCYINQV